MAGNHALSVSKNFCYVGGDTADELAERLEDFTNHPALPDLIGRFGQVTNGAVDPVALVKQEMGATVIQQAPVQQQAAAPAAPAAPQAVEVVNGKYFNDSGETYTYGLIEAPALPDGSGFYILRSWTSQKGEPCKKWVDPKKGPKPVRGGGGREAFADIWKRD